MTDEGRKFLTGALYRLRFVPSLFRRFKFWFLLVIFLLLMAVLAPWVGVLSTVLKGVGRVFLVVFENKVGRFLIVNAFLLVAGIFIYRRFRSRGRMALGSYALDRFLAGLLNLSGGTYERAARHFEKVLRVGRWVNLAEAAPAYPELLAQARIKLALSYREVGEVEKAMKSLELLKVRELSPRMKRELAEAKAFVYALSRDLMPETIDREVDKAVTGDPSNRRLLRLALERAEKRGDLETAIHSQRKIVKSTVRAKKTAERGRLAVLHARRALDLRREGNDEEALAEVARSRSCDPALVLPGLVAGDIAVDRDDPRQAVREWARTPSLPGLERIRALLADGGLTGPSDVAFVAEEFPRAGIFIVLAEHYLSQGKLRKAGNCLRKLEEMGLLNRHGAHLMAEVLRREGDENGAIRMEWRALKGFLGADLPTESN